MPSKASLHRCLGRVPRPPRIPSKVSHQALRFLPSFALFVCCRWTARTARDRTSDEISLYALPRSREIERDRLLTSGNFRAPTLLSVPLPPFFLLRHLSFLPSVPSDFSFPLPSSRSLRLNRSRLPPARLPAPSLCLTKHRSLLLLNVLHAKLCARWPMSLRASLCCEAQEDWTSNPLSRSKYIKGENDSARIAPLRSAGEM
eukprot:666133-Pleurochrysis_carterae.AAC.2